MGLFEPKPYKLNTFYSKDGIEILENIVSTIQQINSSNGNMENARKAGKALKHVRSGALTESDVDFIILHASVVSLAILASAEDGNSSLTSDEANVVAAAYAGVADTLKEQQKAMR